MPNPDSAPHGLPSTTSRTASTACTSVRLREASRICPAHCLSAEAEALDRISYDRTPEPHEQLDHAAAERIANLLEPELRLPDEPGPASPPSNQMASKPLGHTDVFVDDFI